MNKNKRNKKNVIWLKQNELKFFGFAHRNHHKLKRGKKEKPNNEIREKKLKIKELELRKEINL